MENQFSYAWRRLKASSAEMIGDLGSFALVCFCYCLWPFVAVINLVEHVVKVSIPSGYHRVVAWFKGVMEVLNFWHKD